MPLHKWFSHKWLSVVSSFAPGSERFCSFPVLAAATVLLSTGGPPALLSSSEAVAQDESLTPPGVEREKVLVRRGRDVVQVPSLWYQEGNNPPDSLGAIRVPRAPETPGAVAHPEAQRQFPVHLRSATFIRDAQIAEIPISPSVIRGDASARIIIKPPPEDRYDIAMPRGLDPIRQVPGEKTVIDARAWYKASQKGQAPESQFRSRRMLQGALRSTAPEGETVRFALLARPAGTSAPEVPRATPPVPPVNDHFIVSEVRIEGSAQTSDVQTEPATHPPLDLTTTVASLAGPSRADIPGRYGKYAGTRIRGDLATRLRLRVNRRESYALSLHGSTQATFGAKGHGSHHAVPYGARIAARLGGERAVYIRGEASYTDDPFQAQTLSTGDQRVRLLVGMDSRSGASPTSTTRWRLSAGPTYFLDRPSSWEQSRPDARELGVGLAGRLRHRISVGALTTMLVASVDLKQSWGYVGSAGSSNMTLHGRLSIKPTFRLGRAQVRVGPVGYFQRISNEYPTAPGFSEQNLQFGLEATTRVFF
jgi:hypothetical protein